MMKIVRSNRTDRPLALFDLVDGKVHATYVNDSFKREIERGLLYKGRRLRPEDGEDFLEALEKTYASSSLLHVESSD